MKAASAAGHSFHSGELQLVGTAAERRETHIME
jgi:hypothetical protein